MFSLNLYVRLFRSLKSFGDQWRANAIGQYNIPLAPFGLIQRRCFDFVFVPFLGLSLWLTEPVHWTCVLVIIDLMLAEFAQFIFCRLVM